MRLCLQVASNLGIPFDAVTTERRGAELGAEVSRRPFFKHITSLPLGPLTTLQRAQVLLGVRSGFIAASRSLGRDHGVLYSGEIPVRVLENAGLRLLSRRSARLVRLVHNIESVPTAERARRVVTRWVFLSESVRRQAVQARHLDPSMTEVILHPHFHPVLAELVPDPTVTRQLTNAAAGRPILAYTSRIDAAHGIDLFYDMVAALSAAGTPVHGVVMGRVSPGWDGHRDLPARGGAGDLVTDIRGQFDYSQLLSVLRSADAVVAPHRDISQSGAVALAIGERVPVFASDAGANPELVRDGTDGLIFPANNPAAAAAVVSSVYAAGKLARQLFARDDLGEHLDPIAAVRRLAEVVDTGR